MARLRVDYIGNQIEHLGTVEAPDEKAAIAEAVKTFHIMPTHRSRLNRNRGPRQTAWAEPEGSVATHRALGAGRPEPSGRFSATVSF
jgi:hypothetical protein